MTSILQRLSIGAQLFVLVISLALPMAVVTWLLVGVINQNIQFAEQERLGNQLQAKVMEALHHVQKLELALRHNGSLPSAVKQADQAVSLLLKALPEYRDALQFTTNGLNTRNRGHLAPETLQRDWQELREALASSPTAHLSDLRSFSDKLYGVITHLGDTSNLILNPDLDSYYLMDGSLLAIPQVMKQQRSLSDQLALLRHQDTAAHRQDILFTLYTLRQTDLPRVRGSLETAINEDANFYGALPELEAHLLPILQQTETDMQRYIAALESRLARETLTLSARDTESLSGSMDRALALWQQVSLELEHALVARIHAYEQERQIKLLTAVFCLLVGVVLFAFIARYIRSAIVQTSQRMQRLADGDKESPIPGEDASNEFGRIAAVLRYFRDVLEHNESMQKEQLKEQEMKLKKQEKAAELVTDFNAQIKTIISHVHNASQELQHDAQSMESTANVTERQSSSVTDLSGSASQNVQAVAAAVEEMSASIHEISSKVNLATEAVDKAVADARTADTVSQQLSSVTQSIGVIVTTIQDIANQINLLALNATIEAARAGEYGKGFAVVASEVKSLAQETTRATEDIASQIEQIKGIAAQVVQVMGAIQHTIGKVNELSGSMAAAIEEQSSVTNDISRNMQYAASSVQDIHRNMQEVQQASVQSREKSNHVGTAAGHLLQQAEALGQQVSGFLTELDATLKS